MKYEYGDVEPEMESEIMEIIEEKKSRRSQVSSYENSMRKHVWAIAMTNIINLDFTMSPHQ